MNNDPFADWTMADVGCYWSRELPHGTTAHLSTWQTPHDWGHPNKRSGYRLTSHGTSHDYDTLEGAMAPATISLPSTTVRYSRAPIPSWDRATIPPT